MHNAVGSDDLKRSESDSIIKVVRFTLEKNKNYMHYNDHSKVRDFSWSYLKTSVMDYNIKYSKWFHVFNKEELNKV